MAFIIKFVYSFPLSFTDKLIITEERKSSHLVALLFHVLEPRTLLQLFYSIIWDFFFQKIFWKTCDFGKKIFFCPVKAGSIQFPAPIFGWVFITTLYHLILQSWYQKTGHTLVNTLSSFS